MMRRRLLEIALYLAAPIAIFATSPMLAQGLGPDDRGILGLIQSIASFAGAAGALGQAEVLLSDLREGRANYLVAGRIAAVGAIVASIVGIIIAISLGVSPVVALAGLLLVPVTNQGQLWRSIAVSDRKLLRPAMSNAMAAGLRTLFVAALFGLGILNAATAIGAIQASLAIGVVVCLLSYVLVWRSRERSESAEGWTSMLSRGAPMLAFTLLTTVTLRADVVALSLMSTPTQLGIYAGASALSMAVLSISGAFKSRAQAALFGPSPVRSIGKEALILLTVAIPGAILASVISPLLVKILLGDGYEDAVGLLRVLAFASVSLMFLDVSHGLMAALGARKRMILVAAVGAIATVFSLLFLVPAFGAVGAAYASLISYTLAAAAAGFIVYWRLRFGGNLTPHGS